MLLEFSARIKNKFNELYNKYVGFIISKIFPEECKLSFFGLDNSGKTTLFHLLDVGEKSILLPTVHPRNKAIYIGNIQANIFDVGGHDIMRKMWRTYALKVDGIVFFVDVYDEARFYLVKESFERILGMETKAPILVFINKIDLLDHTTESFESNEEQKQILANATGIHDSDRVKKFYISILKESQESKIILEAFTWLSNKIKNQL